MKGPLGKASSTAPCAARITLGCCHLFMGCPLLVMSPTGLQGVPSTIWATTGAGLGSSAGVCRANERLR